MGYYKQGCLAPAVNSRSALLVERARVAGVLGWPEPLPTIAMYLILTIGAIAWVKAGGF